MKILFEELCCQHLIYSYSYLYAGVLVSNNKTFHKHLVYNGIYEPLYYDCFFFVFGEFLFGVALFLFGNDWVCVCDDDLRNKSVLS